MKSYFASLLRYHRVPLMILLATFGLYFAILVPRLLFMKQDGLYGGHTNIWGDWPLHIGMAMIFATKDPVDWFAYHPMYASGKFTYGFLTNLVSGLMIRFGIPLVSAFVIPTSMYFMLFIVGLYFLLFLLTRSRTIAVLGESIFFCTGGLGFFQYLWKFFFDGGIPFFPNDGYRNFVGDMNWLAGNVVIAVLVPQRAFLLGATMAIWALCFLLWVYEKKGKPTRQMTLVILLAALLSGLLPITHMHSFMAMILLAGSISLYAFFFYKKKRRLVALYTCITGGISAALYFLFVYGGIENPDFMKIDWGWSAKSVSEWVSMWFQIWGIAIPTAIVGIMLYVFSKKSKSISKILFFAFFCIWAIANIVVFQPIYWDNSKMFFWSYIGFSACIATVLVFFWRSTFIPIISKSIAVLLFILITATGFTDLVNLQRVSKHTFKMADVEDIYLSQDIREMTDPRSIFLTTSTHNSPVMMFGARPIVLGYTAWVLNFGFQYEQTERDVREIYSGSENAELLIKKHNIEYVVIGPGERWDMKANERFFQQRYPIVFQTSEYDIYDVRKQCSVLNENGYCAN